MRYTREDYAKRITSASPLQLVLITYELVLDFLEQAKSGYADEKLYKQCLVRAHYFFKELPASLNFAVDLSRELMPLYVYINSLLMAGINKRDSAAIDEAMEILRKLSEGFCAIADQETDQTPSMDNAAKVFAGLTYNARGQLGEYIDEGCSRDYRV